MMSVIWVARQLLINKRVLPLFFLETAVKLVVLVLGACPALL